MGKKSYYRIITTILDEITKVSLSLTIETLVSAMTQVNFGRDSEGRFELVNVEEEEEERNWPLLGC